MRNGKISVAGQLMPFVRAAPRGVGGFCSLGLLVKEEFQRRISRFACRSLIF